MKDTDLLAWIDIETTGLEIFSCDILEIACVVTDRDLNVLAEPFKMVSWHDPDEDTFASYHIAVQEMHERNGLWYDCKKSEITETMVIEAFGDYLRGILEMMPDYKKFVMAGSGVARFDYTVFQVQYPWLIEDLFQYYTLDVGVIRRALELANAFERKDDEHPSDNLAHRALNDVEDHMREYKYYSNLLKRLTVDGPIPDYMPHG